MTDPTPGLRYSEDPDFYAQVIRVFAEYRSDTVVGSSADRFRVPRA